MDFSSVLLFYSNRVVGSEDCLHLNVYTPDLPITENQNRLPVMVWLYGKNIYIPTYSEVQTVSKKG